MHDFREETIIKIVFLIMVSQSMAVNGPFLLKILLLIFEITFVTYVVHLISRRPI